jgi:hypothetical protein
MYSAQRPVFTVFAAFTTETAETDFSSAAVVQNEIVKAVYRRAGGEGVLLEHAPLREAEYFIAGKQEFLLGAEEAVPPPGSRVGREEDLAAWSIGANIESGEDGERSGNLIPCKRFGGDDEPAMAEEGVHAESVVRN